MGNTKSPAMSLVVVAPSSYDDIRETMEYLKAQSARDRLELVFVTPSTDRLNLDKHELKDFAEIRIVEIGPFDSVARARAAGVLAASAPVVALTESHSFPAPNWAQALIEAHQGPWGVVGPAIENANPDSMLSWANLLIEYAPWVGITTARTDDHLPGHNSAYKKEVLLEYRSTLEGRLAAETPFHWELGAKGYELYLEPAARTRHLNFSRWSPSVTLRFFSARQFAAQRCRQWPIHLRLLYVLGAPLIPWVRLGRIIGSVRRSGNPYNLLPRVLPVLMGALMVSAAGEVTGYLIGAGESWRKQYELEFDRRRHIKEQ